MEPKQTQIMEMSFSYTWLFSITGRL